MGKQFNMRPSLAVIFFLVTTTVADDSKKIDCDEPYVDIGGRCLLVNTISKGTWQESHDFCKHFQGRLPKLDDPKLLHDINLYFHGNGLDGISFWIDGSDEGHEGDWRYADGTKVPMGTPFWRNYGSDNNQMQSPDSGVSQNCIMLDGPAHSYF